MHNILPNKVKHKLQEKLQTTKCMSVKRSKGVEDISMKNQI